MLKRQVTEIENFFNSLLLMGILVVLALASGVEFVYHENPCPLCMLQRVGFLLVAVGFIMNLRFGLHPNHYAIIILSALFASFVSLRQIALNLDSPLGGFGSPFLGLHLYTWVFVIAMVMTIATTLIMSVERQYKQLHYTKDKVRPAVKASLIAILILIGCNIYTIFNLQLYS